jgi:hypothetical protein
MSVYLINIAVIAIFGILSKYRFLIKNKCISGEKMTEVVLYMIFSVIMGLRASSVGVDTAPYSRIFEIIRNCNNLIEALQKAPLTAPVYVVLCRTLSHLSQNPQILIIVTSIIVNTGLFLFIHNASDSPAFSVFCWVGLTLFYCSMNGNRQCIAVVLVLNSLWYLSQNLKDVKGWLLFVTAVCIHSTAVIMLIAVAGIFLSEHLTNKRTLFVVSIGISTGAALLLNSAVKIFTQLFPRYFMYTDQTSRYSVFRNTGGGRIIILYLFLLFIVWLWVFCCDQDGTMRNLFNEKMIPAVIFCAVFGGFHCKNELINRLLWYFLALYIVFIPDAINGQKIKSKMLTKTGIVLVLMVYSFVSLKENQNGVVPYTPFWIM